jgi:NADPH:quinone reductase-like Zn-dependent oxidoreductase
MPEPLAPGLDFLVQKSDWKTTRFDEAPAPAELAPGRVLFRVDRFALTANNITYALAGEGLGYWRFFPAPEGWGRIPVMGFGDVVRSTHPQVAEGTRCFGFYPMSRYLVIEPSRATREQIVDGAPHRAGLAPVYAQYTPVGGDPLYSAAHEDQHLLLRGLFLTSFLVEDFLGERELFGGRAVLISSASSKTSIALAFQVSRAGRAKAVGLTSARNLDFVKGLGFYDQVLTYDEVASLPAAVPAVFVDMAGNAAVQRAIHEHYREQLRYSCNVGATHWTAANLAGGPALPGPKPEFFFAPAQIQKRTKDWGAEGFQQKVGDAWRAFRDASAGWLHVVRGRGRAALERTYQETLAGRTRPQDGHVLSLWEEAR